MLSLPDALRNAIKAYQHLGGIVPPDLTIAARRLDLMQAGYEALKTIGYYDRSLSAAVRDFYKGEIDSGEFIDEMIRLIEGQDIVTGKQIGRAHV